jgi:hypothetical protein
MNVAIDKKPIFRIVLLLFMAVAAIQITGCGPDVAPSGSTITVTAFGGPIINGPTTNPSFTSTTTKTQTFRISVADANSLPLNDMDVNFVGQFSSGQLIDFGGRWDLSGGNASSSGGTVGTVSPQTLTITKKTDQFGFLDFDVSVPYYAVGVQLLPPYNQSALAGTNPGTLIDNAYSYVVTSVDLAGESTAFGPISIALSGVTNTTTGAGTGSVDLSWKKVSGASSYNIYAFSATSPTIGILFTLVCDPVAGCSDPVTATDNGSYWPQNTAFQPPVVNTTGLGLNGVKGTMQVTSGSSIAKEQAIDF